MSKLQEFVDDLYNAGWRAPNDAQHENIKRVYSKYCDNPGNSYWKHRHDELMYKIMNLSDEVEMNSHDNISEEPISTSGHLYITNDWHICDSLSYAKEHWPEGKYKKYTPVEEEDADKSK